jgi:hypothetical protein
MGIENFKKYNKNQKFNVHSKMEKKWKNKCMS